MILLFDSLRTSVCTFFGSSLVFASALQAQIVFQTDFELTEGYTLGPLDSQQGWSATSDVLVDDLDAYSGQQLIWLPAGAVNEMTLPVGSVLNNSVVYVDFYLSGAAASSEAGLPDFLNSPVAALTGLVHQGENVGEIYVTEGDGVGGGYWLPTGANTLLVNNATPDYLRYTYKLDYSNKTYDLFLEGKLVASDIDFLDSSLSAFSQLKLSADTQTDAYFDNLVVGYDTPGHLDHDGDGVLTILEDANNNGLVDPGETDFLASDTDSDQMADGIESYWGFDPLIAGNYGVLQDGGSGQLIWADGFEVSEGFAVGLLHGQNGWLSDPLANVVSSDSFSGSQSLELSLDPLSPETEVSADRYFGTDGQDQVWISFYGKLPSGSLPEVSELNTDAAGQFTLDYLGHLSAFDTSTNSWVSDHSIFGPGFADGSWKHYVVHLDYFRNQWSLMAEGGMVFQGLPMSEQAPDAFSRFRAIQKGGDSAETKTYLDQLEITTEEPPNMDFDLDGLSNDIERSLQSNILSQDTDADGIPDLFEYEHGLQILHDDASQNADGDGFTNLQEYTWAGDPNVADSEGHAGVIDWHRWTNLSGKYISNLIYNHKFPYTPSQKKYLEKLETPENNGSNFGNRIRGYLVAPVTGDYTFWIAGDENAELWLSRDNKRVGREKIAWARYTNHRQWEKDAAQRSYVIELVAGQEYYIEVLHKEQYGDDHVSVAWEYSGQVRSVISGEYLKTWISDPDDYDEDLLLDSWEAAYGLLTDSDRGDNGYYGDPDEDSLPNYLEMANGTNPLVADTDGDGFNDYLELFDLFTNPLVSDFDNSITVLDSIDGNAFSSATGLWESNGSSSYARSVRGSLEYNLTIATDGVYALRVDAQEYNSYSGNESFDLVLHIAGREVRRLTLLLDQPGGQGSARFILPFLTAGSHSITLEWQNGKSQTFLQVNALYLESLGGPDVDQNGLADWVDNRFANTSSLDESSIQSYVSPYTLEATSNDYSQVIVDSDYQDIAAPGVDIVVNEALTGAYYADVMLNPAGDTHITVTEYQNQLSFSKTVTWEPFNLIDYVEYDIRVSDSLLLEANHAASSPTDAVTISIYPEGSAQADAVYTLTAVDVVEHLFDASGIYTIETDYIDESNNPAQVSTTLTVVNGSLGHPPTTMNGRSRLWKLNGLTDKVFIESDSTVSIHDSGSTATQKNLLLSSSFAGGQIVSRLGESGPIIDAVAIDAVHSYYKDNPSWEVLETFNDGTELWEAKINLGGYIPADFRATISIFKAGVTFDDGTTYREITAADFDENGVYKYYMYRPTTTSGSTCHTVRFYQGNQSLGYFY